MSGCCDACKEQGTVGRWDMSPLAGDSLGVTICDDATDEEEVDRRESLVCTFFICDACSGSGGGGSVSGSDKGRGGWSPGDGVLTVDRNCGHCWPDDVGVPFSLSVSPVRPLSQSGVVRVTVRLEVLRDS